MRQDFVIDTTRVCQRIGEDRQLVEGSFVVDRVCDGGRGAVPQTRLKTNPLKRIAEDVAEQAARDFAKVAAVGESASGQPGTDASAETPHLHDDVGTRARPA